jgi:hypothetical protein
VREKIPGAVLGIVDVSLSNSTENETWRRLLGEPYVFPTPDHGLPDLLWTTEGTGRGVVATREDLVVIRDSHCEVFWNFESLSNGFTPCCLLEDLLLTIKFQKKV